MGSYVKTLLHEQGINIIPVSRRTGHDIRQIESLGGIPPFDVLVHLAAVSYVPDSYTKPHFFYDTNVNGTLNMLEQVRRCRARMVYVSSYVYGQPLYQPIDERHPVQPFNPYAQSKVLAEELCRAYHRDFDVPCTILRPFNIYGLGQAEHFLLPKLVSHHIKNEEVTVFDVRPKRDYVHARDVAKAILLATTDEGTGCEIFNLGGGISYSIPEIAQLLQALTGKALRLKTVDQRRPAEILDTICNNAKAKEKLCWQPSVTFEQGLEEMLATKGKVSI